ncbi:uncharacterized protein LOC132560643 [Ylistrum balloti]|uniref:uncharacterized protein LOC132560643 n=1 Tax=Ylistrum balloti TaxID=509963 RepID=UPI00290599FC|nr:uncharacterized protein LOC132560643 [Ylistrum balloti]
MADLIEDNGKSWLLYHILNRIIGSREIVDVRRKLELMKEILCNDRRTPNYLQRYFAGSRAEGFSMAGSDSDVMFIYKEINVCLNKNTNPYSRDKTVFVMRDAASRPGFVTLELVQIRESCHPLVAESIVPVLDKLFISSEIFLSQYKKIVRSGFRIDIETSGPAAAVKKTHSHLGQDMDIVTSFQCHSYPPAANEWLSRSRLHGWPDKALICDISQSGCHVVPKGDNTSADTFLQWMISFVTAERKLVHSLTHEQFLVYGLLKYFLKQISGKLKEITGNVDILSSYIMKTIVFFTVENTPLSFWKGQNTFLCFMLCLKTLVAWINAGYCPNYFIIGNNMFQGKLSEEIKRKLLRFLVEMYEMNWMCLSVGTFLQPSIGENLEMVMNGKWNHILLSPKDKECQYDMEILRKSTIPNGNVTRSLAILCRAKSDVDEFLGYHQTVTSLSLMGIDTFGEHIMVKSNKEKYKFLRRCKKFTELFASVSTSPGQLTLATYYYQTGNYEKALLMCGNMISSVKVYVDTGLNRVDRDRYQHLVCGRGYTLLKKYQDTIVSDIEFDKDVPGFCPFQLHVYLNRCICRIQIPPLPYALFLSFLCYQELGDTRRRDATLINLRVVKYDLKQGCAQHWIVHNLLGICYEMLGDTNNAIREYMESSNGGKWHQQFNPAEEEIRRLQHL